ncbi:MAG: HAD family hydrolase [Rhodospirillales bacterium]|nr:HAD family hydrolase [Rhodospirillales bacterium]
MPFELIIFDCDGVLVDSEVITKRNMAVYLTELGIPHTLEECLIRYVGLSMSSFISAIEQEWGILPKGFATELRRRNTESSETDLQAIAGIAAILETLNYKKCVASSGHPVRIRQSLSITELLDYFEPHVFSATQVENGKPAPDLFLFAANQMNATPDRCLVIEDSVAGVRAGVAAGMTVVGFTGGGHILPGHGKRLRDLGAHHIIDDMRDLPTLLN